MFIHFVQSVLSEMKSLLHNDKHEISKKNVLVRLETLMLSLSDCNLRRLLCYLTEAAQHINTLAFIQSSVNLASQQCLQSDTLGQVIHKFIIKTLKKMTSLSNERFLNTTLVQ